MCQFYLVISQSGDPALDFIGTGGAEYLPEDSVIPCKYKDHVSHTPSVYRVFNYFVK